MRENMSSTDNKEIQQCIRWPGTKLGMTTIFSEETGEMTPCSVIQLDDVVVSQIKTSSKDGYSAVQIGYDMLAEDANEQLVNKKVSKPLQGHQKNLKRKCKRFMEFRVNADVSLDAGCELDMNSWSDNANFVDVMTEKTIGKGYCGLMKLHNFAGLNASHGNGPCHRHGGGTGNNAGPGRCYKGGKRASRGGGKRCTVQSLKVMGVKGNLILIKGGVPGAKKGRVVLSYAKKKVSNG